MEIYVGNLPWSAEDQDLNDAFAQFGEVTSAKIITDRDTGRSRGFGFVSMTNDDEARQAIESLHDQDFQGRNMNCREATPRQERPRHGGGGGGGGGRGGYNRGGGGGRDRDRGNRY
ncbi:MAG: RNA-binding protein [Opitutales bacterium]|jgi:cold-inducible RNA-binding protein|nr:RNA-binding protein [Opitutales bacterium]